jgi:uncharacterized membrane protein YfcA
MSLGCDATRLLPDFIRRRVFKAIEEEEEALGTHTASEDNLHCHPGPGAEIDLDILKRSQEKKSDDPTSDSEDIGIEIISVDNDLYRQIEHPDNLYFRFERWMNRKMTTDMQTIVTMSFFGFFGTVISAIITNLYSYSDGQKFGIKVYIGLMILSMGIIIIIFTIIKKQIHYALWKISLLGLVAGFNKGISGGGYGPLSVSGQLLCGRSERSAIATTSAAEAIISFFGVITDLIAKVIVGDPINGDDYRLVPYLIIGALLSVPFAAYSTRIVKAQFLKWVVGFATSLLGIYTLVSGYLKYAGLWTA